MYSCLPWASNVPHPYPIAQSVVTTVLVIAFAVWLHVRPLSVAVLRIPAIVAALATGIAMFVSEVGAVRDVRSPCLLALQASMILTACLIAEIVAHVMRERVPRAVVID